MTNAKLESPSGELSPTPSLSFEKKRESPKHEREETPHLETAVSDDASDDDSSTSDEETSSEYSSTSEDDSSEGSDEEESDEESQEENEVEDDEDASTYYSNDSTLTSMPSLAVIPKRRLAPNEPAQFHLMHDGKGGKEDGSNDPASSSAPPRELPRTLPMTQTLSPRIPTRARLSPVTRPAVLVRRRLQRPTIGGDTTGSEANNSSWWEMPLDSLLGYPSLPTKTRVWDPLYECDGDDNDGDDDDGASTDVNAMFFGKDEQSIWSYPPSLAHKPRFII